MKLKIYSLFHEKIIAYDVSDMWYFLGESNDVYRPL